MALAFIKSQLFGVCVAPTTKLTGRTVIVTGANIGLGLHTAFHLARLEPARLIIACRDLTKGAAAATQIETTTGFKGVEVWELDLASFESTKAFAKRCEGLERLDIMVENAGVAGLTWSSTADGWENMLQVNCLSTGLLALLVTPIIARTAKLPSPTPDVPFTPHLTLVSSEVHMWAAFKEKKVEGSTLTALNTEAVSDPKDRYNVSKLIDVFMSRELAALPATKDIIVNNVNPGLCVSELRREFPGVLAYCLNKIARSSENGAAVIAWAAVEDTSSVPGCYVSTSAIEPPSDYVLSDAGGKMQKKLWAEMSEEWKKLAPEVAVTLIA